MDEYSRSLDFGIRFINSLCKDDVVVAVVLDRGLVGELVSVSRLSVERDLADLRAGDPLLLLDVEDTDLILLVEVL